MASLDYQIDDQTLFFRKGLHVLTWDLLVDIGDQAQQPDSQPA